MDWITRHQFEIAIVADSICVLACPFLVGELWHAHRKIHRLLSWRFYMLIATIACICLTRSITVIANFTGDDTLGVLAMSKFPMALVLWGWAIGLRWDAPGGMKWEGLAKRIAESENG